MQRVLNSLHDAQMAALAVEKVELMKVAQACARIEYIASELCEEDFIETGPHAFWKWVQQEGHGFWNDKANRKKYMADNPETRRKVITGRTVITANTPWEPKGVRMAQKIIQAS